MMSRSLVSALGAVALLSLVAALAFAGQPDPGQSVLLQDRIGVSPKNQTVNPAAQYTFEYQLNDNTGAPVEGFPGSQVELDFGNCFNPSTRPADEVPADGPSDVNGIITWALNLTFGGADPCAVDVLVQNVVFATIPGDPGGGLRSPDIDGNGNVALADLAQFQVSFVNGGPPWVGDLNLDGPDTVALSDLSRFQQHFVAP